MVKWNSRHSQIVLLPEYLLAEPYHSHPNKKDELGLIVRIFAETRQKYAISKLTLSMPQWNMGEEAIAHTFRAKRLQLIHHLE